jgi:hypothetical protein
MIGRFHPPPCGSVGSLRDVPNQIVATAVVALLAVTCAACGGGSSSDAKGGAAETQGVASSPTSTPFPTAAAQSAASAAVLSISDFPAGWSTSKDESDDDDATAFQEQLADCLGASPDLIRGDRAAAHEDSPDFDSPDGNTTISETLSVDRMERADQIFAVLHQSNLTDCMTEALGPYMEKAFADSDDPNLQTANLGDVEVGQLSAGRYGDDTVAIRATVPVEVGGFSTSVYLDVLYVRHANAVASLTYEGVGTPVDPETTDTFTRLATRKMTQQTFPTG